MIREDSVMWVKVTKYVCTMAHKLMGIMLGVTVFMVFSDAVLRKILAFSFFWFNEVVVYLIIWLVFIGAALAVREDEHLKVTILIEKLPLLTQFYVNIGTTLVGLVFSAVLFISSIRLVVDSYSSGVASISTLEVPLWIPYLIMPITAFLCVIGFFEKFTKLCREGGK